MAVCFYGEDCTFGRIARFLESLFGKHENYISIFIGNYASAISGSQMVLDAG